MDIFTCILIWTIGGHAVSSQPLFTTNPLTRQHQMGPNLSGDKHRFSGRNALISSVRQPLIGPPFGPVDPSVQRNPPTRPPPPPMAPLISMLQNDLSKEKIRIPVANIQGPKATPSGPKDTGPDPKDALPAPLNTESGPKDSATGPVDAGQGPTDPIQVPTGSVKSSNVAVTEPPAAETTTTPVVEQTPEPTVMLIGCPDYASLYRRDRLVIMYNKNRCEMEVRLKRHRRTRVEQMSVRFRKRRQPRDRQKTSTDRPQQPVRCEEFPVTEQGSIKSIITRPQQCKLELSVELALVPTSRPSRNNRRGKRLQRRPVFTPIDL
ncbi:pistil-specific extensin-like protein [Pecten maximus]|uniref:pistil-specific extensin-like protein n=1 Tax=Pecten maximus TaxID=6579 RepID=UPI0014586581|nr:pistil-specific extensin-like protein [Pecten maximus]